MLFSSVGFSMDIHYCGGEIESIGFFSDAPECEMMAKKECKPIKKESHSCCPSAKEEIKQEMSCHSQEEQADDKPCCHNEKIQLEQTSEATNVDQISLELTDLTFTAVYILINQNVIAVTIEDKINYPHYSPPLLTEDVAILHQVFII